MQACLSFESFKHVPRRDVSGRFIISTQSTFLKQSVFGPTLCVISIGPGPNQR